MNLKIFMSSDTQRISWLMITIKEVKQIFLSNVPAADSHPNLFGISPSDPSYWGNLFLTGCATSCVA